MVLSSRLNDSIKCNNCKDLPHTDHKCIYILTSCGKKISSSSYDIHKMLVIKKVFISYSTFTTNISIAFHWLDTISIFGQSCKTSHWPIKDVEAIQKKGNHVYIFDDHKHMNLVPFCNLYCDRATVKKIPTLSKKTFSSSSSYALQDVL
jgi:hypothetical protein